ncbi:hypothetical protein [Lucifera butyrica]|uniref:hypothetical protein n=1 Tax=Lucifera butyrica TaxID=1351585 RepID=UPI001402A1F1|nr:hypothetical protein [Lucifera butyrica]
MRGRNCKQLYYSLSGYKRKPLYLGECNTKVRGGGRVPVGCLGKRTAAAGAFAPAGGRT